MMNNMKMINQHTNENTHEPIVYEYVPLAISVETMAKEFNISRPEAYKLAHTPGFPSFSIGRRILINRKGLQRWMDVQSLAG